MLILLTEQIPLKALSIYANSPLGSPALQEQSKLASRVQKKMLELQLIFTYFITNGWIYQTTAFDKILSLMSAEDQREFPIDVRKIDWRKAVSEFAYGIRRFYIKEDIVSPLTSYTQLLSKNQIEFAHDIKVALGVKASQAAKGIT